MSSLANEFRLLIAARLLNLVMWVTPRHELRGRVIAIGITRTLRTLLTIEQRHAWSAHQTNLFAVSKK